MKILMLLMLFMLITSCGGLVRKETTLDLCVDCLHYKQYEKAVVYCKNATVEDSSNHNTWLLLSDAYTYIGDYEKGLIAINKSISLNPNDHFSWIRKANLLKVLGKYDESIECQKKAEELVKDGK